MVDGFHRAFLIQAVVFVAGALIGATVSAPRHAPGTASAGPAA
jgi:hypothetical protein